MSNHFVIICAYPDSLAKKNILIELVEKLKHYENLTLCYSTHHKDIPKEVIDQVDYIVYNKNNPILNWDIIDGFTKTFGSQANFADNVSYIQYYQPYHGYAHHLSVCDGISMGLSTGHKTFSLMNYDCIDFCLEELPVHIQIIQSEENDGVFYPYNDTLFNTEFFTFNESLARSLIQYREYSKFSNFENMMYEKMVMQVINNEKYKIKMRNFKTENKSLGKIAFTGDHFSEVKTVDKYFIPFFERWIEDHRYVYYFFPIIYNGKHCITIIDESHESMNCHVTINDKPVDASNGKFYQIKLPVKMEMFENDVKKFSVILNDDRQFGAFFSSNGSRLHPQEKIVL